MHALLIHQAFVSPGEAGGTRHFELASYLVRRGHRFSVVASDLSYLSGKRVARQSSLVRQEGIEGVHVLRAYTYPSLHRSLVGRLVSLLSFMFSSVYAALRAGRVDLVIGTSPPIFQAASAWLVALLRRRPFLLEVRDLWPEFMIDMGALKNRGLIALARWLEGFLYARAIHIVVNSPAYRDYLLSKGVAASKIDLIANGVDAALFDPQAKGARIREKYGLDGKFVVTYAGALGMANDIDTILQAAQCLRHVPTVHFLLVGDGIERPRLEAQAEARSLYNVTFTGVRPKAEMPEILGASDACVATLRDIPMFRTTYPNKVFDYMAAGRPTILGIDGVIRQVVEAAEGGIFVPPGDSGALADAVRRLVARPALARAMGAAAREYVVRHFNRADQARAFEQLAVRLAGPRAAVPGDEARETQDRG